jgi:integral membrane sensor domain MASE1
MVINTRPIDHFDLAEKMTEKEIEVVRKGISPVHIVLTAIMAGVLAVMILYAAITTTVVPAVAAVYPATAFEVVFGCWFGVWGAIAAYIGLVIAGTYAGWFPLPLGMVLALGADLTAALIPAAAFRLLKGNVALKSRKDWLIFIVFGIVLSTVPGSIYYNLINFYIGLIPSWEAFWVAVISWNLGNFIVITVIGTPLLKIVTPYVKRTGLYVRGWLS